MEKYISIIVRVLSAIYILYRTWNFLFKNNLLWKVFTPKKDKKENKVTDSGSIINDEIVGKTNTVYLKEIEIKKTLEPEPTMSIPLEAVEDITADDMDYNLDNDFIPDEDIYTQTEDNTDLDYDINQFSTGLTFAEISQAVDVIKNLDTVNNDSKNDAAKVLFEVKNTDMFDFFTTQISNTETIERLFRECLDNNGNPLNKIKKNLNEVEKFNIDKYI